MTLYLLPFTPDEDVRDEWDEFTDVMRDCARLDVEPPAPLPAVPFDRDPHRPTPRSAIGLILAYVEAHPGRHARDIGQGLAFPRSTVAAALARLCGRKLLRSVPEYHNTRYYPNDLG